MIGLLCSDKMEKSYAEEFHSLFKIVGTKRDEPIIVFTILNINFEQKTVTGSLISENFINHNANVPIPRIIFNLSLQRNMSSIRVRKRLEEIRSVTLVNEVNRYDQWMIMDMLNSSKETQKYLLTYHIYDKGNREFKPEEAQAYIAMPARGASLSRVIYAKPDENSERVIGNQYFKKGHICDYIDASLCQTYWIFIEMPDIKTYNNSPVVVRNYVQKVSTRTWKVLGRRTYPQTENAGAALSERINSASLNLINNINCFLPSLGICFIDFIISTDGYPYFLHFGGFDEDIFAEKQKEDFYKRFYKNLLKLAGDYETA